MIEGRYFDGGSARSVPVQVSRQGDVLLVDGDGVSLQVPVHKARLDDRLGSVRRALRLAGGGQVQFADAPALDGLVPPSRGARLVAALERHWGAALASVLVVALGAVAFFQLGLPLLAERLAQRVPPAFERETGEQVLALLDAMYVEPTALDAARRAELRAGFAQLAGGLQRAGDYRLHFRSMGMPNAFALPGGAVVLTDELVELAGSDAEILAVLAHELGHQEHRHGLRMVLQDSAMLLVFASVTGDVSSLGAFTSGLPTLLLRSGYSRGFEREADAFAFALLRERGHSPQAFADIMRRFRDLSPDLGEALGYLSTHPATAERIAAAEAAK